MTIARCLIFQLDDAVTLIEIKPTDLKAQEWQQRPKRVAGYLGQHVKIIA